jgi:steroid 5-alpha reductase family enzyme
MLITALICFTVSEITSNYSQVDKLWSIMPIVYSVIVAWNYPSARLWLMSALVAIWGIRLSLNFGRKGGYSLVPWRGEEDYRWKIMRERPELKGRFRFGLFNLFFISLYQNLLILLFSSPLLMAATNVKSELNITDMVAATIMLSFIVTETVADNQQFRFQKLKKQNVRSDPFYNESLKSGFVCNGLWKHVRHPNFISEQMIWAGFYLFGVGATGKWLNWTITGLVLLILLFQGSTHLTEKISSGKYPAYADYKKRVPKFFPGIFRSS